MPRTPLDHRSRTILLETVNDYIVTAEPVSSRTLSKKLAERLSPATIRNVMADLEEIGLLYQPHTSAGRIPTDAGYRYFVDEMLRSRENPAIADSMPLGYSQGLNGEENLSDVLGSACHLLSDASHQTGLVMVPSFDHLPLKRIEFLTVNRTQVLAVFISNMGLAQNRIVNTDEAFTGEKLASISRYLNTEFAGQSLQSIRQTLMTRLKTEREHYHQLMKKAAELCAKAAPEKEGQELLVEGLNHLLDHPELSADLDQMKALLRTVEDKDKLIQLLDLCMKQKGLSIVIGEENSEVEMQGCSLIAGNYQVDADTVGTMAIFGPKRMDYLKMIDLVNLTANNVSNFLSKKMH